LKFIAKQKLLILDYFKNKKCEYIMDGTVKFYNFKKRFGFITGSDGKDYFVHQTGLKSTNIRDGMKVTFEIVQDDKGSKAVDVNVVEE
jgi:CspA family cold shock protein